jgi:signal transduction histidine kinase
MPQDDDDLILLTFEILHDLARESDALHAAIKRVLQPKNTVGDTSSRYANNADASFYPSLEWRIAERDLSAAQMAEALDLIIREIHFFRLMVHNQLGAVTRSQPLSLRKLPVKLITLIEDVVELFRVAASHKGVELRTHLAGDSILLADRELIHRALVNIVDNAIKYSYSGGERFIVIESRRHSIRDDWMISVASYGVGIDANEISTGYIFEYGTRGKLSGDRGRSGTGIGLAEAKRIVEAHHGRLNLESRNVTGDTFLTTVKIILPNGR